MGRDLALGCCAASLALWGLAGHARAQQASEEPAPEGALVLAWSAPDGCPDGPEVRARVDRLLDGSAGGGEVRVRGTVEPAPEGFALTLTAGDTARTLRGASCDALADAATLIVAMMVDPRAALSAAPAEPEPSGDRPAQRDAERAAKGLASTLDEPTPDREPPRRGEPVALTPPEPSRPEADDVDTDAASTPWHVAAGVGVEAGPLPGAGVGPALALGFEIGAVRLEAHGRYLPASRASVHNHATAAGDVSLVAGGVQACVVLRHGALEGGPCAGAEAGVMRAVGRGVSSPGEATAPWGAVSAGGWLGVELAPWLALRADVGGSVPLTRPAFVIDGIAGEVHRPAPVAGRVQLGAEVRFR